MNPGKIVDRTSPTRISASGPITLRGAAPTHFSSRKTMAGWITPLSVASAWAVPPQHRRRHDVPELSGDARRRSTPPEAGHICSARCSRARCIPGRWRNEEVKESLDLCLSCKGCKGDCPVQVDMATYKAEFLSHYYAGRLRPLSHYAFGNIDCWARLASNTPGLANITTQLPFLRDIAEGSQPEFPGNETSQPSRRRRSRAGFGDTAAASDGPLVILWPDTFNNYFFPKTARPRSTSSKTPASAWNCRREPLLRSSALRFRNARARRRSATPDPGRACLGNRSGRADRGPGAKLRDRVPR